MSPRHASRQSLNSVSFWQFARAKRYHIVTLKITIRMASLFGVIYLAISLGDYLHAHPIAIIAGSAGAARFVDRGAEVLTDVICDRLFPMSEG